MPKFRKRPITVEAEQFNERGDNAAEIVEWALGKKVGNPLDPANGVYIKQIMIDEKSDRCIHVVAIKTLEGEMVADAGCWVIRGTHGELYPCQPEIFEKVYEPFVVTAGRPALVN